MVMYKQLRSSWGVGLDLQIRGCLSYIAAPKLFQVFGAWIISTCSQSKHGNRCLQVQQHPPEPRALVVKVDQLGRPQQRRQRRLQQPVVAPQVRVQHAPVPLAEAHERGVLLRHRGQVAAGRGPGAGGGLQGGQALGGRGRPGRLLLLQLLLCLLL